MNGARSTFMRKGYLLTALAAAVLLAASPGIASAQSVSFATSSGSLPEGATGATNTPAPLHIYVNISGIVDDPATEDVDESTTSTDGAGAITIEHNLDGTTLTGTDPTAADARRVWQRTGGNLVAIESTVTNLAYRGNGRLELVIIDPADGTDGNWLDEKYTLKLASASAGVSDGGVFNLTIVDDEVAPVAKFKHVNAPSISLQEASTTTVNVGIDAGTRTAAQQGVMTAAPALMAMVSPADAKIGDCGTDAGNFLDIAADGTNVSVSMQGTFSLGTGTLVTGQAGVTDNTTATYPALTVEACSDMANFRDMQVELSFVARSLGAGTNGADGMVANGGAVTITVDSNEATPTVSFATSSIDIDEGGTNTVAILADGELGPEVGSVMVSKSGDATLSLWQGDDMLEAGMDGMYEVDLMGSANTILTISADSDRDLEDGMTSMATLTIESANGANIGDGDSVMVTVMGSTAVPALPLVGQLLLALFLMAGGTRLYRRRQG